MTSWHEYHQYALENGGMDEDWPSESEILIAAIRNVLKNMRIVPDPGNQGLTDCYLVPLDDIEDLEICLQKYEASKQATSGK